MSLFLRLLASGPSDHDSNFGGVGLLGTSHYKCLTVGSDVISADATASVELAIKQFNRLGDGESWLNLHRGAHHLRAVTVNDLFPVSHPARLLTAGGGDLPAASRAGHRLDIDFRATGFVRDVCHPVAIRRKRALAFGGWSLFEGPHPGTISPRKQ